MNNYELIRKIVAECKYKVIEDAGEHIIIRYQLNVIHICPGTEDDHFVSVLLSNFADVTEDNFAEVVMKCHRLNVQMKQVKLYTIDDLVVAAAEFYFLNEQDLDYQIRMALDSVIAAKVNYKKQDQR